ncbi:transposase [Lacrimispora sp.]|uniref:transposase n=1 Tax=Lacrimispora sp. TaxID=2719234 RepID=UPI0028AFBEBE|nr:transposase [Lacrimispora sp.]
MAKYEYWLTTEGLILIEAWARDGLTDEQVAKNIGVNRDTLYTWKKKYPDISDALKRGKEVVDIEVENALFKKATGFTRTIKKAIKVKEVLYEAGKRKSEKEHIEFADEEIYIPPDTTAQIFWLKNRKPDTWRDKQNVELSGEIKTNNPYEGLTTEELKKLIHNG